MLDCTLFSIRLHRWYRSDDKRFMHDHPWWFWTMVLWGSYMDVSYAPEVLGTSREFMERGAIAFRPAEHRHFVVVPEGGCITLLITGPTKRIWGFWVNGKWRRREKYFKKWGHPPCDEQ